MTKRMLIMLGCIVLLIAGLAFGKYLQIKQLIASAPKAGAQTISAAKAEALEWQPQLSSVGTVSAFRGVDIGSEITGLVRQVHFKSGQNVKRGAVLIELNADADIAQLHALEASAELSATVLKRDQAQLAVEGVSQAQVDADMADLKSKRALVAQQAALVEKKTIRAPFDGRLGISTVNPGQYVNTGDKLVSLQTVDPIFVDFFLPQKQISSVKLGQNLKLRSDAFPGQEFVGQISAINPKIDTATRNVQIQASLSNQKQLLLPGMFANVAIDVGDKNKYITLPQTAITYNPYGSTVFVVKDGDKKDEQGQLVKVAQQVFVTTGATRGDQVAVLKGIEVGQMVVTSGQLKLKNGTPVIVDNSVQPKNSPNPTPQEH
ncbi:MULTISPECIES: efflux RND transporter periplasmic adaptor subunit [unclassified Undibacterium]|uniref:efflux RND transporter periplasmic adaptor subunit n=1 Tax=unclassified Undibacterium TaxID=2630295 RepID=UPI002AC939F1|nr:MULTISPECIES: efflux RND transporter periplasmic adaptor subunit [unclassified Undibacterium]MEB0139321.1 efflux RND transporter periplasmic adaptor subunit [Undibacterium sp. CCC2.1]MEB0172165.1 efflux RND transporter periplasmic adaptor subunit [Undibacterium sp. CCC1.1]MEB0176044.1 efflux RND transporter periplasmic adaptor subunit [Undibacterium sp. CCC3.4]MEB0215356.1 efflux RND transporter periplasmic adaptor subunit [Undibacterium sp. 5I2]WPX43431.1 efflux RND transporter periplasmic